MVYPVRDEMGGYPEVLDQLKVIPRARSPEVARY